MAQFEPAFQRMLKDEGGMVLHNVPGDRGGQTYAGIARNMHPKWAGWPFIDKGELPPTQMVREFYKANFWDDIRGDQITSDRVASNIFNFYVNTGRPAKVLAQVAVGATPDGAFGPKTVAAINEADPEKFILTYTLAKIARYRDIVARDRTQIKFIMGWLNRSLGSMT